MPKVLHRIFIFRFSVISFTCGDTEASLENWLLEKVKLNLKRSGPTYKWQVIGLIKCFHMDICHSAHFYMFLVREGLIRSCCWPLDMLVSSEQSQEAAFEPSTLGAVVFSELAVWFSGGTLSMCHLMSLNVKSGTSLHNVPALCLIDPTIDTWTSSLCTTIGSRQEGSKLSRAIHTFEHMETFLLFCFKFCGEGLFS